MLSLRQVIGIVLCVVAFAVFNFVVVFVALCIRAESAVDPKAPADVQEQQRQAEMDQALQDLRNNPAVPWLG